MEAPKIITCRTCLGPLDFSFNLCEANYKHLLDLLHRLLGYEIQIKGAIFSICRNCEGKLVWVAEFKDLCDKSLRNNTNTDCKQEFIDIDDYTLCLENNDFDDFEPENSGSDSDFTLDQIRKRQKEIKTGHNVKEKVKKSKPRDDKKWKRCRSKQYPPNDVMQAIAECTNYFTDVKNRTCVHCDYIATTAKMLSIHMHTKHWNFLKAWCNRCNLQTDDLDVHKSATKCCEDRCKFCYKKCGRINRLTEHLRTHCHEVFKKPDQNDDFDWDSTFLPQGDNTVGKIANAVKTDVDTSHGNHTDTADTATFWFKEDPFQANYINKDRTDGINVSDNDFHGKQSLQRESSARINRHTSQSTHVTCDNSDNDNDDVDNDGNAAPAQKRVRKGLLQQFPHTDVERAIKESMRSFHTNRECIICGTITRNSKFLSGHMTKLHKKTRDKWCSRCNSLVENLVEHKNSHRNDMLKCSFCERGFNTIVHLKDHLKGHSRSYGLKIDSNWFSCKHCPNSFPLESELREHKCKTSRSKRKISKVIDSDSDDDDGNPGRGSGKSRLKQFLPEDVQQAINDSMKSFHENRKCIICGFLASHSRTLSFHMSKVHKNMTHRWCSRCNTLVDNLPDHKESHKNDLLKCKFCGRSFNKIVHLKDHLKCHSRSYSLDTEPKWFSCKECPNTYPTEQELKGHDCKGPGPQNVAASKFNRPTVCMLCKKRVRNLKIHMKHKHNAEVGPNKKLCSVCGKIFLKNYDLAIHMRTHTGELPYKCSYCEKRFGVRTSLLVHEKRHLGEKPHVCHVCGKAFVTPGDLRRHVEIHEGGPEQCPICEKQFCRPGVLKLHMKRHTGENPFSCIDCGLSFHRRSLLLLHIKKHSNERPYKCSFCEKDFKHRQEMKDHERIHKGIKPYKCSQCSYTCGKSYSLTLHMKQHPEDAPQSDRPHKCLFCYKQFSTNAMLMSHTNNRHRDNME